MIDGQVVPDSTWLCRYSPAAFAAQRPGLVSRADSDTHPAPRYCAISACHEGWKSTWSMRRPRRSKTCSSGGWRLASSA